MSKHTPGPWVDAGDGWIESAGGISVIEYAGCGSHEAEYSNPADKSLILAAPDLLEALEALVKSNEDHNARVSLIVGKPTGWHDGYLDKAHAAIAKARGEA